MLRGAKISLGVDPLGGAGVHYWSPIADRFGLNLTVVNQAIDSTFRFMTLDWDGQIRMDPSSPYADEAVYRDARGRFEIAFACDTDHDRHGIVTKSAGLLPYQVFRPRLQMKIDLIGHSALRSDRRFRRQNIFGPLSLVL